MMPWPSTATPLRIMGCVTPRTHVIYVVPVVVATAAVAVARQCNPILALTVAVVGIALALFVYRLLSDTPRQ